LERNIFGTFKKLKTTMLFVMDIWKSRGVVRIGLFTVADAILLGGQKITENVWEKLKVRCPII